MVDLMGGRRSRGAARLEERTRTKRLGWSLALPGCASPSQIQELQTSNNFNCLRIKLGHLKPRGDALDLETAPAGHRRSDNSELKVSTTQTGRNPTPLRFEPEPIWTVRLSRSWTPAAVLPSQLSADSSPPVHSAAKQASAQGAGGSQKSLRQ